MIDHDNTGTAAPCGSWASPITAARIAGGSTPIEDAQVFDDSVYWIERRPLERGRSTLMRLDCNGAVVEMTAAPFSVRSTVHEYGGGAWSVGALGIFCCRFDDQQVYQIHESRASPSAITSLPAMRFADFAQDALRNRLIAVCEDHSRTGAEAINALVAIDLATGNQRVLADGHDFFSSPALSPDGRHLAWLTWDHPNMPWDGTDLWLASVGADGTLDDIRHVAGGRDESIFQPGWSPSGELHLVSDRSGWWNLYRVVEGIAVEGLDIAGRIVAVHPVKAEFGVPQWAFAMRLYDFDAAGSVVAAYSSNGKWNLARIDPSDGSFTPIETSLRHIRRIVVDGDAVIALGGSAQTPEQLLRIDLTTNRETVIRASSTEPVDPAYISIARPFSYPTTGDVEAHAFHYAPVHRDFRPLDGERPPLIVTTHGGPTGATSASFSWLIQFWTSRGFGVVDVNYGGSAGYGREYRNRLRGQWGVVDVDDAVNAAKHLVAIGAADGDRVAIRGGSAGGYTTLCALTFRDFFHAGASHYGIGDLESLAQDTHKFESRYLESLIGPYPDARALYVERSPIHHTGRLSRPMILFQGSEDKAVPPNQAKSMYDAVRAKGLPVAYVLFEGEGHGFRRAENIMRAIEAELYFYGKIFGFTPADPIEPVAIDNLGSR